MATQTDLEKLQEKPKQQQPPPGQESKMTPRPITVSPTYKPSGKLLNKVALITGGDSGIGRAVAAAYALEGADVAIIYLNEHEDAEETRHYVEKEGRRFLSLAGDIGDEAFCRQSVKHVIDTFGKLDILINNAAEQHPKGNIEEITAEQLEKTFRTNVFGMFYLVKAAMPYLKEGAAIINTASVTAYKGNPQLLDYSATKGAIVAFTRALAQSLTEKKIRVNGVAPGPIWTPLIPSTFPGEKVEDFGAQTPMGRVGQPFEVATSFVFLASEDSSYFTGQMFHPNGGTVVNA